MDPGDGPKINATAVSFRILDRIKDHDGMTMTEIVEAIDKPTSTVHDHLQTLTDLGYLVREDDEYVLGMKLLELGGYARTRSRLCRIAESEIQNLALDVGDHANLMVEENGLGVFLLKRKGDEALSLDTFEGKRVHLHTTALGKSMLAYMDDERLDGIIEEHGLPSVTENTITDEDELRAELDAIRERGYATDDEERLEGIRCVAAPVRTSGDEVVGAVSVSGIKSRMQGEHFRERVPQKVLSTVNIIEVNMRHK
ncbi:IclR family transcriptional regulator [Halosimplex aquaticum]|uniref:IclR family transcriptional regulator n=1 Tax=Halosimplex aquaticum TaxID=3026162 RepID=A0ABD5Y835_9EURY|nr:IclR family transcriptional regulator [Halosimplex aquaticum]